MSAPELLITSCGAVTLPSDFDILRPASSSTKPCVSTASNGATPRVPQLSSSEDWNQPRCWSEPSRYMTVSGPPSFLRRMPARLRDRLRAFTPKAGEARESLRVFQHECMRGAGIEPDIEDVVHLLPRLVGERAEKTFARTRRI